MSLHPPVACSERHPGAGRHGFTLLELLTVVAVVAVIGGLVVLALGGLRGKVQADVSGYEMRAMHDAIKAFRRDTGYYPKQGPFALTADGGQVDPTNASHWPSFLAAATSVQRTNWFLHPGNFYQLVLAQSPLNGTGHVLETFRPQTGRGWRGPYLKDGAAGTVAGDAGQYDPASHAHTPASWNPGDWNGVGGTSVANMIFVCDAQMGKPGDFPVRQLGEVTGYAEFGRPYFYFLSGSAAWLVGMGPDRTYQGGSAASDDVVLYISE